MSKPTGFRAMTPGINNALSLAQQWGTQTAVAKSRAILAFNKVTKLIGVNAQGREIINMIASFTRDCDWEGDSRPLAWPDNQRLMDETGLSPAALKRNLRLLAEAGLIAFKDSPSGRRIGRRNRHTNKIDLERSYGIDLSPLGIRTPELEEIAAAEERRASHMRNMAHQFTCSRKMLTSILEAATENDLPGPWRECADELASLAYARRGRCDTERLESLCARVAAVLERARTAYAAAVDKFDAEKRRRPAPEATTRDTKEDSFNKNMSPLGNAIEPPIQNTTEKKIQDLYREEWRSAPADQIDFIDAGLAGEEGFGIKPEDAEPPRQDDSITAKPIDLNTIKALCPQFWQWVYTKNGRADWTDVVAAASGVVRANLHIPESTWKAAAQLLGRETAAVAIALICEKHAEGIINTPGAYLNGMLTKAQDGKLHLPPSLFHWRAPRKGRSTPAKTMN